jgi:hypothetical protein
VDRTPVFHHDKIAHKTGPIAPLRGYAVVTEVAP